MADRDDRGRLLPGNRLWELAVPFGRTPIFDTAQELWDACVTYFEWVEENPLWEDKLVTFQGVATHEPLQKARIMSIRGLCLHLGIVRETWYRWRREREEFAVVIDAVESIIWTQKIELAAAELVNPGLVARDLGLADRSEVSGPDGGPIETTQPVVQFALPENGRDQSDSEAD